MGGVILALALGCGGGPRGNIVDAFAIDRERAVLVRYEHAGGGADRAVVLVDGEGRSRWHEPAEVSEGLPWGGFAAGGDRIVQLRASAEGVALVARSAADGSERWRREVSGDASGPAFTTHVADEGLLVVFAGGTATAVDMDGGGVVWTTPLGARGILLSAWLQPSRLVLAFERTLLVLDRARGEVVARHPTRVGSACALGPDVVFTTPEMEHRLLLPDLAVTPLPGVGGRAVAGMCGTRGGELVLAVSDLDGAALVGVDRRSGEASWQLELGGVALEPGPALVPRRYPAMHPLSGELGRYVPVRVSRLDGSGHEILTVDLDRRALAGRTGPQPMLLGADLVRDTRSLLLSGGVAVGFDDETGRWDAARAYDRASAPRPYHLAGGVLVVYSGKEHDRVDEATLASRSGREHDASAEIPWVGSEVPP